MKDQYIEHKFSAANEQMLETINRVLDENQRKGYVLSLRQLYYQLVTINAVANTPRSYANIGTLVSKGRDAGRIDWDMIEDRGRVMTLPTRWDSPAQILKAAAYSFHLDLWENQPYHIEVMCEKDALSGILGPVCRNLDVGFTANKGYSSSSAVRETAIRLAHKAEVKGKKICVVYLGDHDPSGIDMSRDIKDRLMFYGRLDDLEVVRIALNMDQVERYQPPENPAKQTDSRFAAYIKKYGSSSWELDALKPETLSELVTDIVMERRDPDLYAIALTRENKIKDDLRAFAKTYEAD